MVTRREFLKVSGAGVGLAASGALGLLPGRAGATTRAAARGLRLDALDLPAGVEHVVLLMMENRSFDHLLSWLPGADGVHDLVFPEYDASFPSSTDGLYYPNYPLAPDFQGCGYSDADHSWEGWLVEYNNGALNGFLQRPGTFSGTPGVTPATANTFPIGYYTNLDPDGTAKTQPDLPVLGALAQNYTVCDRYFAAIAAETFPNRFYQHAGQTDRDHNSFAPSSLATIWDQLWPFGVPGNTTGRPTGAYYFSDLPYLLLWQTTYAGYIHPYSDSVTNPPPGLGLTHPFPGPSFLDTVAAGNLANVTFVDPAFNGEGAGTSDDDHPLADLRLGERLIADVYHALHDAGYLDSTVLVVTFDEWGGFYDHVPPPTVIDTTNPANVDHSGNNRPTAYPGPNYPNYAQLGFRVPCIVVSSYAPAQVVGSPQSVGPFEHTSTLALIESLFGLNPLTDRDKNANNLGMLLSSNKRSDDPASLIPTSSQVPGPATQADAICGPNSVQSVSPAAVNGPVLPETPGVVLPAVLAAGAAGAAYALHRRRERITAATAPASEHDPELN
jgi:phospholipase C